MNKREVTGKKMMMMMSRNMRRWSKNSDLESLYILLRESMNMFQIQPMVQFFSQKEDSCSTPAILNRFRVFLAGYFNSKTNLYGFRIKTIRDGPKRYVNPRFKENDESVFEINVKAIKTLVDAAGEVDSVRRDQVSASEKVAESLLMLREIRVPGLHEEGRDAIYIEFLRSWQSQWKKTERSQEGCVTLEMVCCKFNFGVSNLLCGRIFVLFKSILLRESREFSVCVC